MTFLKKLAPLAALASLLMPSLALADQDVRSCCILTESSRVTSCYQFTDAVQGDDTQNPELNVVRQLQNYKCQNIPYVYSDRSGQTASYIANDRDNSGICGTALSSSCNSQSGASVPLNTVHAKCQVDADCGSSPIYTCQSNYCKIKENQGCIGTVGTEANCASGLLCMATGNGKKCLSPDAEGVTGGGTSVVTVGEDNAPFVPVVPNLSVPIPGFSFTPASEVDGEILIPYLAEYVNAIYRYMTAIVLTVAIVMIVYGGFKYLLASTPLGAKDGKAIITDAIIGMTLVLGAYVILNTVNPSLLSLQTLRIERIQSREMELSLEFGGAADDGAYAPEESAALSSIAPAPPGTWRANALAACGDSNVSGMSQEARKARLKSIVTTWTNLASTQQGSIYVRGGSLACSPTGAEYEYKAKILSGIKSAGYGVNVPSQCFVKDASNKFINAGSSECQTPLSGEYRRLVAEPGARNGLICGDCGSYQRSLMKCFGGDAYAAPLRTAMFPVSNGCSGYRPGPDDVGYIRVTGELGSRRSTFNDTDVTQFINRLQFGDMLMWSSNSRVRHVFMYTGKAGLPYEIVEMGGGGQGDVLGSADGKPFWAKIGLPNFDGSHVKMHRSAESYIKSSPRSGAACIKAVRVIDN